MDDEARIAIGSWPTPVRRLDRVSDLLGVDVWAKLEEECGTWGGNKVRKLEYILGRARADDVSKLVSFGAGTSNWTSALAFHGAAHGFGVEVVLSANEVPPSYRRLYFDLGTRLRRVNRARFSLEVTAGRLRPERDRTRVLPMGGTCPEGNIGSLHAGREIAAAISGGQLPKPALVFVATGTSGTAAGVAAGFAHLDEPPEVVCVRVAPKPYGTTKLVRKSIATLARAPLRGDERFFAPGYARPNSASIEAAQIARLDELELDQTYAAKAFASLVAHARAGGTGPLLFLHTSPGPPPRQPRSGPAGAM